MTTMAVTARRFFPSAAHLRLMALVYFGVPAAILLLALLAEAVYRWPNYASMISTALVVGVWLGERVSQFRHRHSPPDVARMVREARSYLDLG
jgi:hypothetical protein